MASDSDDDYDALSDFDMSMSDDEEDLNDSHETPITAPQTPRSIRASDLKTITCPYTDCNKLFNRQARLEEHLRSHTNERPFKCQVPDCHKDFIRSNHLKRHQKSAHSNVRDYNCTWQGCNKSFSTGTRLRRHQEAHKGREKFQCKGYDNCDATFRKHDTLRRHIISVHEQMRPFSCPETDFKTGVQCTQAFETAEKLRHHQRSKHDPTRFTCTLCLEQDQAVHMAESSSHNETTSYSFATYAQLQSHISTIHPPTCHLCPTSFSTSKELSRHLELQHGLVGLNMSVSKVNYACSYPDCGRVFGKKGNLSVHIKTVHEKRKDFVCGQTEVSLPEEMEPEEVVYGCGRDFTSKASLEEHVRTAHLGLISKRIEREQQQKLQKGIYAEMDGIELQKPQQRKARKDKGAKKGSALSSLLGDGPSRQRRLSTFSVHEDAEMDANDLAESQCLSGSVTMYGGQLYHADSGRYDYPPLPNELDGPFTFNIQDENRAQADLYSNGNYFMSETVEDEPRAQQSRNELLHQLFDQWF